MHGITASTQVESWPLPLPKGCGITENSFVSVAGDGSYLYFHGPFGLLKVGSGYANTKKVKLLLYWLCAQLCYVFSIKIAFIFPWCVYASDPEVLTAICWFISVFQLNVRWQSDRC